MNLALLDMFCAALIVAGLVIAFKKPSRKSRDSAPGPAKDDPRIYVRRIAGVMMAAFGLALAVLFTAFHFA